MAKQHMKAGDVFANTDFMFGRKCSFAEAFPTIEEASIEVEKTDFGQPFRTHHRNSRTGGVGEYFNCSNPRCYNGGVNVGEVLRDKVSKNLTQHETPSQACQGYEGSPKGRRRDRTCAHGFKVKATIKYKAPLATHQEPTQ